MMTEEEAKKKWCPLARSGDTRDEGRISVNRCGNAADMDCFCIASACMAWQSGQQEYENGEPLPIGTNPADPGWEMDGTVWCAGGKYGTGESRQHWRRPLPRKGWCSAFSNGDR